MGRRGSGAMRQNTSRIRISAAQFATASRQLTSSIAKIQLPPAAGHGIAGALNAGGQSVAITERRAKRRETRDCGSGGARILARPPRWMLGVDLRRSMELRPSRLSICVMRRVASVPFASAKRRGSSSTIATRKGMFAHCFAKPVTPSSDGMRRRQRP